MEIVCLVGAGSAMFTRGLTADFIRRNQPVELRLVDTDPVALRVAADLARRMAEVSGAPVTVKADTDRRALLPGCTAVICTIGVGGRRAWEQDVFIPRNFGIWQPVGDTVMPGGTSRAMRMIPAMVEIARDVLDLCPDALFFNYGNPMSPVCRAIRKATGAPVVGLCHGVPDMARWLAAQLHVTVDHVAYSCVGINHLSWFTEFRVDGRDAMPALRQRAEEALHEVDEGADPSDRQALCWRLLLALGAFPAPGDRHVVEFLPWLHRDGRYYNRKLGVDVWSFEACIADGDAAFAAMQELADGRREVQPIDLDGQPGEHEQVVEIIDAIRTDRMTVYSANLPNRGQAPDLPTDAIIECPAVASASGLHPLQQPPMLPALAGLLATRFGWVETVVDAALRCSRDGFIQALLLDGSTDCIDTTVKLADALIEAHGLKVTL